MNYEPPRIFRHGENRRRGKRSFTQCIIRTRTPGRRAIRRVVIGANFWQPQKPLDLDRRRWEPDEPTIRNFWAPILPRLPWIKFRSPSEVVKSFGVCFACGQYDAMRQRAHIVPRSRGGPDEAFNLHILCPECHASSECMTGLEYWRWFRAVDFNYDFNEQIEECERLKASFVKRRETEKMVEEPFVPTDRAREIFSHISGLASDEMMAKFFDIWEAENDPRKAGSIAAHAYIGSAARVAVFAARCAGRTPQIDLWLAACEMAFHNALGDVSAAFVEAAADETQVK